MARIAYFVHGRGRGHASRAVSIVPALIAAGHEAEAQARAGETKVHRASVFFGLAIWLVPTLPLLLAAQRDEAVRAALAGGPQLEGALLRVASTGAIEESREVALAYARSARACRASSARAAASPDASSFATSTIELSAGIAVV